MKRVAIRTFKGRTWAVLGAGSLVSSFLFAACGGSDSTGDKTGGKGGSGDEAGIGQAGAGTSGASGTSSGGSSGLGGSAGKGTGGTAGNTSGTGGSAGGGGPVVCVPSGGPCGSGPDCCSFSCVSGECSADQCTPDGDACTSNDECCGGTCTGDVCVPLNGGCKTSGNTCTAAADCCSKYCVDGLCSPAPSYCVQTGDTCRADTECCAGRCAIADGATLGTCTVAPASGATGCLTAGEVCSNGATYNPGDPLPTCGGECCSRACFPYGPTGVLICQPPSGCHPTGELCTEDLDCCGAEGRPDGDSAGIVCSKDANSPIGRCDNGNACTPAGGICRLQTNSCNANANCCSGNVLQNDTCKQDNLGIPRCLAAEIDCTDPSNYMGQACASSADCCNLPCVANPDGNDPPYVCGGDTCVAAGGSCTTTADCCRGLPCTIAPGSLMGVCGNDTGTGGTGGMGGTSSTGGTTSTGGVSTGGTGGGCSAYGQACETTTDCCNGVPCTAGYCLDMPH